jgi:hypothetical protein
MTDRRDYLAICNDQGVPLPDFQATFCVRCVQPECSRSKAGGLFDARVRTWQERLFVNPPKMSKDDPLYSVIAAKKFRDIDSGGRVPEVGRGMGSSIWVDPLAVDAPGDEMKPLPRAAPPPPPTVAPPEEAPSDPVPPRRSRPNLPLNTRFRQGAMVGGAASPKAVIDPWAAGEASQGTAAPGAKSPVVSPGAKIRFRGR